MTATPTGGGALGLLADVGQLALVWLMIPFGILLVGLPVGYFVARALRKS